MKDENKKIVVLAEDGYEDLELWYPAIRLKEEGYHVDIVGSGSKKKYIGKYGTSVEVDLDYDAISSKDYDGIIVPGGWAPDKLRRYAGILDLVKAFADEGKLLATICHGGWVFISAKVVDGYKMTCVNAIIDDIENAGATYIDDEVVVDRNMITSRTPKDLPSFMKAIINFLQQ
ncbi:type 1 glutamine amidotransferase domain-containing protein [Proteiniborus sp. MB09-C3]|uniref:type 1 glutamine amidotransferase domain-containing protein n=1 Tax=Proteiniborus sp. MB09-C3 TaxID=3050072 RepID=UPI0025573F9F|nr:type 1 glutamine amidotransferase domain-containing protein [Proteiniborus sp. MB09-C3]WIV12672.1 type 1 glutamine amidotransferase domain-containing protein [Proteiniborus sp. MB09-C3]